MLAALDQLRAKAFKPRQWANYFTYHLVGSLGVRAARRSTTSRRELEKAADRLGQPRERGKRCVEATEDALGDLVGQRYVRDQYFAAAAGAEASALVDAIARRWVRNGGLDWMGAATRRSRRASSPRWSA